MSIIDAYAVFSTTKEIFLRDLSKLSMRPLTLQKVSAHFSDGEVNEHDQNTLNYFNHVKETTQTCK